MAPAQKRLNRILLALAVMGSLLIGGLWWDSTRYSLGWRKDYYSIRSKSSQIYAIRLPKTKEYLEPEFTYRRRIPADRKDTPYLFPQPRWSSYGPPTPYYAMEVPYYLILVGYLGTIFITWHILKNRLARRVVFEETASPDPDS